MREVSDYDQCYTGRYESPHLLSLASTSSTASHASIASFEVAPNFFEASSASCTISAVSARALYKFVVVVRPAYLLIGLKASDEAKKADSKATEIFMMIVLGFGCCWWRWWWWCLK